MILTPYVYKDHLPLSDRLAVKRVTAWPFEDLCSL